MNTPGQQVLGRNTNEWYGTGWVDDADKVAAAVAEWEARGLPVGFREAAARLMTGDDNAPVFFWQYEQMILNVVLATWNQRQVGACVGFGFTRASQDLLIAELAAGEPETWPGAEGAPEITYAGSRFEIGGGQINGDGSLGIWAADWLTKYGYVVRGKYGALDLTAYNETTCRKLGASGVPSDVETLARAHPVKAAAMVTSAAEGWAAIGANKPIAVCSNQGFSMTRNADGTCDPEGVWNHCMGLRGRFVTPKGKKRFVIGNSWGDYLGSANNTVEYLAADGSVKTITLPPGHFAAEFDTVGRMLSQRDSFALAGMDGWKKTVVDYTP